MLSRDYIILFFCYSIYMRKKKKYFPAFLFSIVAFIIIAALIIFWSPNQSFTVLDFSISTKIIFFILIFINLSLFGSFVFSSYTRGFLLGFFLTSILLLKFFGFTNLFYPVLLILLFILVDRLISMRG